MTFHRESLSRNRAELEPLFEAHWKAVPPDFDNVELGFDWEQYGWMEKNGNVHLMVARDEGSIVGYHLVIAQRHLHSMKTQVGVTAFFYLLPQHRKGWSLVNLFKATERSLKEIGVNNLYLGHKTSRNLAPIMRRMGYHQVEALYAKRLA